MLYIYVAGMILVCLSILQMEMVFRSAMHQVHEYHLIAMIAPVVLVIGGRSSGSRWGATAVASVYFVFVLLMSWFLPLFPAEPKLGPVYIQVTHFVPPEFPLLLIVPAFALDLLWQRTEGWNPWKLAAVSAVVFVATFIAVQWPFANFLMSPGARNWFFGAKYFSYFIRPTSFYVRYLFFPTEQGSDLLQEWAWTLATAALTIRLGLATAAWMRGVRR